MKSSNLQKLLATLTGTVLTGVVLMSSGAAGALPVQSPPANGVGPTFTSLAVTGNATFSGETFLGDNSGNKDTYIRGELILSGTSGDAGKLSGVDRVSNSDNLRIEAPGHEVRIYGGAGVEVENDLWVDGDLDVTGMISGELDFQYAASNFSESTSGPKTVTANCPGNKKLISCDMIFSSGQAYVRGGGSALNVFGSNICIGSYYQTSNSPVSGWLTGTCL